MRIKNFVLACALLSLLALITSCTTSPNTQTDSTAQSDSTDSSAVSSDSYQFEKDVCSANEYFDVQELEIPESIHSYTPSPLAPITSNDILLLLYENPSAPLCKEVGIFNVLSREFKRLIEITPDTDFLLEYADSSIIVYKEFNPIANTLTLYYYSFEDQQAHMIYAFAPEYPDTNQILVRDNYIYFDDVVVQDGQVTDTVLYQYDITSNQINVFADSAQQPLAFKDDILFIRNHTSEHSFTLGTKEKSNLLTLSQRISGLASSGDELYSVNNKALSSEYGTIWNIVRLSDNTELLTANIAIDQLVADQDVLVWRNFMPEYPTLYSREHDCFMRFEDLGKNYNTFLLGKETILLLASNEDNPEKEYQTSYYLISSH